MTRFFIFLGILFIIIGLLWPLIKKLGLGNLPGDIIIRRENFTFYFPIVTGIFLSVVLSIIFWLLSLWWK